MTEDLTITAITVSGNRVTLNLGDYIPYADTINPDLNHEKGVFVPVATALTEGTLRIACHDGAAYYAPTERHLTIEAPEFVEIGDSKIAYRCPLSEMPIRDFCDHDPLEDVIAPVSEALERIGYTPPTYNYTAPLPVIDDLPPSVAPGQFTAVDGRGRSEELTNT